MLANLERTLMIAAADLREANTGRLGREFFYSQFEISKGRKKTGRLITAPSPALRDLHRLLLVLGIRDIPTHHASTAFRAGCSIAANARRHAAQPYLFKTDIVDFFPSIPVEGLAHLLRDAFESFSRDAQAALVEVVGLHGCLAQGSPVSPHLSNVFMREFDHKMFKFSKAAGARYTRYADDIAISASSETRLASLADATRAEVGKLGLRTNETKTRIVGPSQRKIVTGLDVTTTDIRPTKKFRKKTEAMLRAFLKYEKAGMIEPLRGRLAFWNGVAPHDPVLRALRKDLFGRIDEHINTQEEPTRLLRSFKRS